MPKFAYYISLDEAAPETVIKGVKNARGTVIHAENWANFIEYYNASQAACLIIDLDDAKTSGLNFFKSLSEKKIYLPVIILTSVHDVKHAVNMMKAGAFDYQLKPTCSEELTFAVTRALTADQVRLDETCSRHYIQKRYLTLSPREQEVVKLIENGRANKVIAIELDISNKTAETHRSRIMTKMHADNLSSLIQMLQTIKSGTGSFCPSFSQCPKRIDLITNET